MALSNLINGQTIEVDNHNRGNVYKWDRTIHLHKRMNSDKFRGMQVIIPIADDGDLEFRKVKGHDDDIHIKNEIANAFSNTYIRNKFVKSMVRYLNILFAKSNIPNDEWQNIYEDIACKIARHFDLTSKIKEKLDNDIISFYRKEGNLYIKANKDKETISIGDNVEYL